MQETGRENIRLAAVLALAPVAIAKIVPGKTIKSDFRPLIGTPGEFDATVSSVWYRKCPRYPAAASVAGVQARQNGLRISCCAS